MFGLLIVRALTVSLALLNVGAALARRRPIALVATEGALYAWWIWLVLFRAEEPAFSTWLGLLVVVLVSGAVAKFNVGAALLRRMNVPSGGWPYFGTAFRNRTELAKIRMAAREQRAKELGVNVIDVMKMEHAEEKKKRR